MTPGRTVLAAVGAAALVALAPGARAAGVSSGAGSPPSGVFDASSSVGSPRATQTASARRARAKRAAVRRRRAATRRIRWRPTTAGLRLESGVLFGSLVPGTPGAPGSPPGAPGPGPGTPPPGPPPVFHALAVAAREYSLTLSRPLLTPGLETIQLNNRGEDPHDLVISPEGTHDPFVEFPETPSLSNHTKQVELPAGRYRLWCSLPGHEALGMRATLRVE